MSQTRIQGIHHIPVPQHSTIPAIPETNARSARIVQENNRIIGWNRGEVINDEREATQREDKKTKKPSGRKNKQRHKQTNKKAG